MKNSENWYTRAFERYHKERAVFREQMEPIVLLLMKKFFGERGITGDIKCKWWPERFSHVDPIRSPQDCIVDASRKSYSEFKAEVMSEISENLGLPLARRKSDICKKCCGKCCNPVFLKNDMEYFRDIAASDEYSDETTENSSFIVNFFTRAPELDSTNHPTYMFAYKCEFFDDDAGMCGNYQNRPPLCRNFECSKLRKVEL